MVLYSQSCESLTCSKFVFKLLIQLFGLSRHDFFCLYILVFYWKDAPFLIFTDFHESLDFGLSLRCYFGLFDYYTFFHDLFAVTRPQLLTVFLCNHLSLKLVFLQYILHGQSQVARGD